MNEIEIIDLCKKGDQGAFQQLLQPYMEKAYWTSYPAMGERNLVSSCQLVIPLLPERLQKGYVSLWNS